MWYVLSHRCINRLLWSCAVVLNMKLQHPLNTSLGLRHGHALSSCATDIHGRGESALRCSYVARRCTRGKAARMLPCLLAMIQHPDALAFGHVHAYFEVATGRAKAFASERNVLAAVIRHHKLVASVLGKGPEGNDCVLLVGVSPRQSFG
jgi:hypothetical protein